MRIGKDLTAAAATPLVLGILADGDAHGYAILQRMSELSGGELDFSDGMLYPVLHRLERLGSVEATWQLSAEGRRRKVYRLTRSGRSVLAEHRAQWTVVAAALERAWHVSGRPSATAEA